MIHEPSVSPGRPVTRREFLRAATLLIGSMAPALTQHGLTYAKTQSDHPVVEIVATASADNTEVFFDPVGVLVRPETAVRWRLERSYHSATAYHPDNHNHELRIPANAKPWDSGLLLEPGASTFETTLTVPGVYDYFCFPHEHAGMVGRIIVGSPAGPGAKPFNYDPSRGWSAVPDAAQRAFPPIEQILDRGIVRYRQTKE